MKLCWRVVLLWASLGAGVLSAETRDPTEFFFDTTFGNLQDELTLAREQGKQGIFIFFEMDECPFCHRMRLDVLNQVKAQDYYKANFLSFTIDIEGDVEMTDFQGREMTQKDFAFKQHRVRATPVLMYFDLQGRPVARYTGSTSGIEEFIWLGEYVVNKVYEEMPFTRYKRMKRSNARQ